MGERKLLHRKTSLLGEENRSSQRGPKPLEREREREIEYIKIVRPMSNSGKLNGV